MIAAYKDKVRLLEHLEEFLPSSLKNDAESLLFANRRLAQPNRVMPVPGKTRLLSGHFREVPPAVPEPPICK